MHRSLPVVTALVAATALSACGGGGQPSAAPTNTRPVGSVRMSRAEAQAAMTDYDRRHNAAAIAAGRAPFDEKGWARAEVGPYWESDVSETRYARESKQDLPPLTGTSSVRAVLAQGEAGTGSVALIAGDWTLDGAQGAPKATPAASTPAAPPWDNVWVMRRSGTAGPWRQWMFFSTPREALPAPLPEGVPASLTPAQTAAAKQLPDQLVALAEKRPTKLTPTAAAAKHVERSWPDQDPSGARITRTFRCRPYAVPGSADTSDAVMSLRMQGATLSVVTLLCDVTRVVGGRGTGSAATASPTSGSGPESSITALIAQRDSGRPTLLGFSYFRTLPR